MKKRILATLMAMVIAGALIGCGNTDAASASMESSSAVDDLTSESLESDEEEESKPAGIKPVEGESESEVEGPNEESIENETASSTDSDAIEENSIVHGIVLSYSTGYNNFTLAVVDPDTGGFTKLASFRLDVGCDDGRLELIDCKYTINRQELFAPDCQKIAMDKYVNSSGEVHVGWLNADKTYFDLTEALGEQSENSFSNPKHYHGLGFTPDGRFAYYEEADEEQVFYVYVDNPTVKYEGNPMLDFYIEGALGLTAKLDDATYLSTDNWKHQVFKRYINDAMKTDYFIPGEDLRCNRSAVLSPDGSNVAFLSVPKNSVNSAYYELFVMPLSGSEPQKIELDASAAEIVGASMLLRWQ